MTGCRGWVLTVGGGLGAPRRNRPKLGQFQTAAEAIRAARPRHGAGTRWISTHEIAVRSGIGGGLRCREGRLPV